ncbi:hypothetical protein Pla52o_46870 [Novipirellula galeiformis]|uniref:Uncharacterized protein n=1 Tax=Novipirellula galeiformis TaxID=2528004 RepID=A0A5C6C7Q4_9BACT|nr:hypothetical protein [Novipirellula galeiformis]TWU20172.1 hypothetical protein Pla52o_46870 [Novipirellula galeiformis]
MATQRDEFDPPQELLTAVVTQIAIPVLTDIASEIGVDCVASVKVCVRDDRTHQFNVVGTTVSTSPVDENTEVRLRFRKTYRDDRILFAMDTQHADAWRDSGFSGVWIHGDIVIDNTGTTCRIRDKTICYNQGWHNW